ncbi:MAG TPA: S41 family peptidase [Candidatus Kaiserbacteria bacterium]|nr:S41 family peptidase [Candidatus Kaiserbacteria bacterium]
MESPEQYKKQNSKQNINKRRILVLSISAIILLAGAFSTGVFVGSSKIEHTGASSLRKDSVIKPKNVDFSPVWKVWNVLNKKYASATTTDNVTNQKRVWGMIQGLTNSLGDPYTVFFPPADAKIFEADISGNFEGVGMEIAIKDNVLTVVSPLKGTPAYRAGILSGDKIIKINGESTEKFSVDRSVKLIRGKRGTEVVFTILREGKSEFLTIPVVRDVIQIPTISTSKEDGAGLRDDGVFVIQLYNFSALSQNLFRKALREFVLSRADKLILDLRGNPGGYLESSVDMASWFLPVGKIVVEENFGKGIKPNIYRSRGYNIFNKNLKMAIVVNRGSASASEILAGALKEQGVATLIGERTFGKGSVQELVQITKDTSLKVTIARWFTPLGNSISNEGLKPDIEVGRTEEDIKNGVDPQIEKAAEFLKSL